MSLDCFTKWHSYFFFAAYNPSFLTKTRKWRIKFSINQYKAKIKTKKQKRTKQNKTLHSNPNASQVSKTIFTKVNKDINVEKIQRSNINSVTNRHSSIYIRCTKHRDYSKIKTNDKLDATMYNPVGNKSYFISNPCQKHATASDGTQGNMWYKPEVV